MPGTPHKVKNSISWWTTWEMIPDLPLSAVGFPGKVSNVAQKSCSNSVATLAPKPAVLLDIASLFLLAFFRSTMSYLMKPPRRRLELLTTRVTTGDSTIEIPGIKLYILLNLIAVFQHANYTLRTLIVNLYFGPKQRFSPSLAQAYDDWRITRWV
jgi:hypothetical protein